MRKEVFYAIATGILIGLIVAFGTWKISKMIKQTPSIIQKKETPSPKKVTNLLIDNLKNYDVVTENPTIKGLTSPNTDVIFSTIEKDFYTKSNSEGEFEMLIEIPSGISEIKINEAKLILIYSTEVETGRIAYTGTITDISEGNVQVKNDQGIILQISISNETKFINTLKKNIEVKGTDLAIGDYIVAIGTLNGNGTVINSKVLNTERILISSPLSETNIEIEKIEIEKLSKTKINDITLPKKWSGPNVKELEVGQEIYVIGTINDKTYTLRTIIKPVE